ncbi:growth-regulating factor 8 [Euphorbia peplus]|nr:growth-regulating factor 8 [Euphorbia peplus]
MAAPLHPLPSSFLYQQQQFFEFMMGTRGHGASSKPKDFDFGLGLRMQPNHNEPSQISPSSSGGGAPPCYTRNSRFGDIYDVVASKSLQPFCSSEMTQCLSRRVPFTVAQWQELERQNIIYRYLMASVPVPAELLIPILRTQTQPQTHSNSNTSSPQSNVSKGSLELGISSSGNSDPEPWRCKRTDGKKWRCSRDVAPDQKYCERHSHKSRPRSRKPVELHSDLSMANHAHSYANLLGQNQNLNQKSLFRSQATNSSFSIFSSSSAMVSVPSPYDQPRNLEWFLKGETVPITSTNSNEEWHPLRSETTKSDDKMYHFRESQHLDSNSYAGLRSTSSHPLQTHRLNDNCSLLLSANSASLSPRNQTQAQETRHFLDVWSSSMRDSCSSVSGIVGNNDDGCEKGLLKASSLSLSMAGSDENENGEASSFGCGLRQPGPGGGGQWMNHGSWMGSTPGGPLAEALCLGISSSTKDDSNFSSSHGSSSYGNTSGIDNKT